MLIYLLLLGIIILPLLYTTNFYDGTVLLSKEKTNKKCAIIIIIICVLLQGLRAKTVGGDLFDNYGKVYLECGALSWSDVFMFRSSYEMGYALLNKIVSAILGPNELGMRILLFIIAIVFHLSFYNLIKRYSSNPLYSIFLYVCLGMFNISMNNLRSTMALAFAFQSIKYIYEKRPVKSFVLLIIATLFHTTVISFIVFYISCLIHKRRNVIGYFTMIALAFLIGYSLFGGFVERIFPKYTNYLSRSNGGMGFLLFLAVIMAFFLIVPNYRNYNEKEIIALKVFASGFILQIISLRAAGFVRAVNYHLIGAILFFPEVYKQTKLKNGMGYIVLGINIMFIVFYVVTILMGNGTLTVPYVFFWNSEYTLL